MTTPTRPAISTRQCDYPMLHGFQIGCTKPAKVIFRTATITPIVPAPELAPRLCERHVAMVVRSFPPRIWFTLEKI